MVGYMYNNRKGDYFDGCDEDGPLLIGVELTNIERGYEFNVADIPEGVTKIRLSYN